MDSTAEPHLVASGDSDHATRGQTCDRCRRRKTRCYGAGDECSPCLFAGVVCVRSVKLQRNRKRKSFYESEGIEQRRQPPSSQPQARGAQHARALDSLSPQNTIPELRPFTATSHLSSGSGPGRNGPSTDGKTPTAGRKAGAEPIIGHMGRLVTDDQGVAMFAGSTTGVHFISQAEQQVQMLRMNSAKFPSCAYSLYLHDLWGHTSQQPSDEDLTRAVVAGLPLDAEDILLAAIDRWTPIYPVVHKATTMEAFRDLIDSSTPSADGAIVILHQVLGLLALGSVGNRGTCTRDHFHFLCLSETHYSASATLLDKVLERPCLQTLQALEIMQVYLQVSARYTMASHLGGIATRLAQSLGLHRHSQRFRFDPLETELRRRVWWCQYSLDTFSSTYHGLPRLIRDQDVDTDLPTSVDHDLLSRSHVAFPLPGEGSQVDSALHLFKIARIIGDTLENLYSTTRRRGGVAKISRLQAELDMWTRSLPGAANSTASDPWNAAGSGRGIPLESGATTDVDMAPPEASFETSFLKVVLCIATIQVHRPALSFTGPDPQSTTSLHASTRASATFINILASGLEIHDIAQAASQIPYPLPEGLLLSLLYPSGAHMLWQAGLTLLYAHWKLRLAVQTETSTPSDPEDEETVRRCVLALRRLGDLTSDPGTGAHRLGQCADVLDMLREKTFPQQPTTGDATQDAVGQLPEGWDQVSWNVWDWPMESVLEFTNSMDVAPLDFFSGSPEFK